MTKVIDGLHDSNFCSFKSTSWEFNVLSFVWQCSLPPLQKERIPSTQSLCLPNSATWPVFGMVSCVSIKIKQLQINMSPCPCLLLTTTPSSMTWTSWLPLLPRAQRKFSRNILEPSVGKNGNQNLKRSSEVEDFFLSAHFEIQLKYPIQFLPTSCLPNTAWAQTTKTVLTSYHKYYIEYYITQVLHGAKSFTV